MLFYIALALVFLVPAHVRLKAKGYPASAFTTAAIILTCALFVTLGVMTAHNLFMRTGTILLIIIGPSAAVFALAWGLPERPGSKGLAYLEVRFACPSCGREAAFPRERQGLAGTCPHCGEVVSIPAEGDPPPRLPSSPPLPGEEEASAGNLDFAEREADILADTSSVCVAEFVMESHAHGARMALEEQGIAAVVALDGSGSTFPIMGVTTGHRVMVSAADRESALKILHGRD